ncbi:hypothetical protein G7054_g3006 [Neopestalotiopsis clavispora]|nr:hypothetical protein G7054_g3006 [Neopestalotiopsis clavispora]
MEMLDHDSIQALSFWKSYPGNSSVLLHLHGETKERANWTTHFTLEMIGCIAQSDHATGAWQTSAVLAHFCAQQDDAFRWTQEVLLRDFLSQIHRSRLPELEAAHDCGTHRQEDGIFHDVAKKPAHMWELLRCAVTTAGIKSLYVFIDNLDYMQEKAQLTAIQEFNSSFHEFLVGCQQARITVKLVITSQSTEIDYHYPVPSRIALKADFDDRSK